MDRCYHLSTACMSSHSARRQGRVPYRSHSPRPVTVLQPTLLTFGTGVSADWLHYCLCVTSRSQYSAHFTLEKSHTTHWIVGLELNNDFQFTPGIPESQPGNRIWWSKWSSEVRLFWFVIPEPVEGRQLVSRYRGTISATVGMIRLGRQPVILVGMSSLRVTGN